MNHTLENSFGKPFRKLGYLLLLALAAAAGLLLLSSASASAASYYVNNQVGSACSDAGSGTSTAAPWCSFAPISSHGAFAAGDQILLAKGETWNEQMSISGTGTAANPIVLGAYGSGAKPKILRNGLESDRAIALANPSHWTISGLEIGQAGAGIVVSFSTAGHEGLVFKDLYLHDIKGIHQGSGSGNDVTGDAVWNSAGIEFTSKTFDDSNDASLPIVKNVLFEDIEGSRNLDTISIDWYNGTYSSVTGYKAAEQVVMRNLNFHRNDAGGGSATGCDDGMRITDVRYLTLIDSRIDGDAGCHSDTGTAAIYLAGVYDANIFNNVFTNVPHTSSPDMVAFDFECCTNNVNISENYFAGNAGAGISFLAIHPGLGYELNTTAAGNTFVQNGSGSFRRAGTADTPTGAIRDNLYHEANAFLYEDGADYSGFTVSNNQPIKSASAISHASASFGSSQGAGNWTSRAYDGTSWTNLAYYDAAKKQWQPSSSAASPSVSAFELQPSACASCAVARVWTAPLQGTVSLRARVLMAEEGGDGVVVRITKNGTRIWPVSADQSVAGGNRTGYEAILDGISVNAGDELRFEVSAGSAGNNVSDAVSWAPSVAYTNYGLQWDFAAAGNLENWTMASQISGTVSGGVLTLTSSGSDPYIVSADNLNSPASNRYLRIRLKNNTNDPMAQLFFTTTTDTAWSSSKSITFATKENASGYMTYVVDLSVNPNWTGTIKQLRFDPISKSGTMNVDFIQVTALGSGTSKSWEFGTDSDAEGWTSGNQISSMTVSGGSLTLTSGGTDPYIYSPDNLGIDNALINRYVRIRLQNQSTNTTAQFFFTTTTDTTWNAAKSVTLPILATSDYMEYVVDMGAVAGWTGTIKQLRFDPLTATGTVQVDFIRITD
ncbi:right-handed parallel beta-helix repeat-containing protein [Cohnella fermenti]|uniref:Right-handed parallel beta-helix repeat-containing protein n=1 Tax=Cohnella fermenti TaxID=2565925 RepID=A0A4S4C8S2_9BACL|nr:right-handed parallel beta-helix repeat-containing protein [Cohnella fermenti]THF84439.1 right-handed parallel beta-helix repeat-containing protein [Cohnella fermenti]